MDTELSREEFHVASPGTFVVSTLEADQKTMRSSSVNFESEPVS